MKSNLENTRERLDELGMCSSVHFLQNNEHAKQRRVQSGGLQHWGWGGGRNNTPCDLIPDVWQTNLCQEYKN